MPKYMFVMQEEGEGCDYTIGCGMRFEMIGEFPDRETALEAAKAEFEEEIFEYHGGFTEHVLKNIYLTEIVEDFLPIFKKLTAERSKAKEEEKLQSKREQLKRLKEELGET